MRITTTAAAVEIRTILTLPTTATTSPTGSE